MTTDDRKLVLVVDADQRFIDATRRVLHPHRTLTARDLDEAREIVLGGRVDLVVLGAAFASEHSIEEAKVLRSADPTVDILLAADIVTNRLLKAALRAGFVDVLDLPLTADALADTLPLVSAPEPVSPPVHEIDLVLEPASPRPGPMTPARSPYDPVAPSPSASPAFDETTGAGDSATAAAHQPTPVQRPVGAPADLIPWGAAPAPSRPRPQSPAPPPEDVRPTAPASAPHDHEEFVRPRDLSAPPIWPDESQPTEQLDTITAAEPDPKPESVAPPVAPPPAPPAPAEAPPVPAQRPVASDDVPPVPDAPPPPAPFPIGGRSDRPQRRSGPGRVIAVMAGKGGSGKSVVATNLAIAMGLRSDPERVVIVDADLQFGDVALMLQVDPVRTIDDVIGQLDSMTDARLDGALLRHESGLRVLPAPLLPVRAGEISAKSVVEVVDRLRGFYDTIVVDTGPVFDDGLVTILEHADAVVAVVDMDLPSVKNSKVALDALRAGGFPMERITLVVNRVNSKARLDLVELERSLGLRVGGSVPSDRLVPQSVNEGIPLLALSPRSKVARSFMALAERLDPRAKRERLGGGDR